MYIAGWQFQYSVIDQGNMRIKLTTEESTVLEVTKAFERNCIADNTSFFISLNEAQRELFFLHFSQNSAHKITLCLDLLSKISITKIRRRGEDISRAFEELNFSEHFLIWKFFSELFEEWDDSMTNDAFDTFLQILSTWRNKKMAHTRDYDLLETSFEDYVAAAKRISELMNFEFSFEGDLGSSLVKTNMPIPEYEKDGGKFVGRTKDRREVRRLIAKNHVTCIAGRGGLGKTALAQCLVKEYENSGDFDYIIWFSCKTDKMSPSGIRELGKFDSSFNRLLLNSIRVYEGDEMNYEDDGDREFMLNYLEDLVEPSDKLLIVLDNYETLEIVGEEDYSLFQQYLSDVEDLPFSKNVKWLLTSRNTLSFAATKTLDRLDDSAADKLLLQSIEKTDNFPSKVYKKTRKKDYRSALLKGLHNYPLYIKMFCGWLGLGKAIDDSLRVGENVEELEEFCFRNTVSLLNDDAYSQVRRYLLFILETTEQGIVDLLPADYCKSLTISSSELSDYHAKLTSLSVIINSEEGGVQVAPAMAMYIKRQLRKDDVDVMEIQAQVSTIKKDRQIRVEWLCLEYRSEFREEYKEAISAWSSVKNISGSDLSQTRLLNVKSRFENQLSLFYSLTSSSFDVSSIKDSLKKIETEATNGYAYWSFIRVIWQKTIRLVDPEIMLEFGQSMKSSFPKLIEPKLNVLTQEVFVHIQKDNDQSSLIGMFGQLKEIRTTAKTGMEKKLWKVAFTRVLKSLSDEKVQLGLQEVDMISSILEDLIANSPLHKGDFEWTSRVNTFCLDLNRVRWSQWIDKGATYWHNIGDYDAYVKWNQLLES